MSEPWLRPDGLTTVSSLKTPNSELPGLGGTSWGGQKEAKYKSLVMLEFSWYAFYEGKEDGTHGKPTLRPNTAIRFTTKVEVLNTYPMHILPCFLCE